VTPRPTPYDHAPRLPSADHVDVRELVRGQSWELEVGPGRGGFLFERAEAEPTCGLVGLEVRRKWATIVDGRIDPSFVVTHRLALDDGPWAYRTFRDKEDGCIKVVLKPDGQSLS